MRMRISHILFYLNLKIDGGISYLPTPLEPSFTS